jgi:hypothetical protein
VVLLHPIPEELADCCAPWLLDAVVAVLSPGPTRGEGGLPGGREVPAPSGVCPPGGKDAAITASFFADAREVSNQYFSTTLTTLPRRNPRIVSAYRWFFSGIVRNVMHPI